MPVRIQRNAHSNPKPSQGRESFRLRLGDSKSQLHRCRPFESRRKLREKEQKSTLPTRTAIGNHRQTRKVGTTKMKMMKRTCQLSHNRIQISCLITWARLTSTPRKSCNFWRSKNRESKWRRALSNRRLIRQGVQEATVYKAFKESKSWLRMCRKHTERIMLLRKWKNFKNALLSPLSTRNPWNWYKLAPTAILSTKNWPRKKRKKNN